jgi:translation initiation factor 3 subunit B
LEKHLLDRFKQFLWRPRPRTLLGKEQQRQIRRNLKEFSRTFDEEDAAEESSASKELVAYRKRLVDEWNHWRAKVREELAAHKKRVDQEREDVEEVQEWVDELIDTVEEEILD